MWRTKRLTACVHVRKLGPVTNVIPVAMRAKHMLTPMKGKLFIINIRRASSRCSTCTPQAQQHKPPKLMGKLRHFYCSDMPRTPLRICKAFCVGVTPPTPDQHIFTTHSIKLSSIHAVGSERGTMGPVRDSLKQKEPHAASHD